MDLNKEKNFASAVVYCYNDAVKIGGFIENLDKTLASNFLKYEIIVVNDASTDNSVEEIKRYAAHKEGKVFTIINMSYTHGLEAAMNAGVDLSIGDFVFEFDTVNVDYEWEFMMDIYYHSLKGYDVVSASPERKLKVSRRLFYIIFNRYTKYRYPLKPESFRVLSRRAINRVRSITQNPTYRKAAYANCGLDIDTLSYKPICDVGGKDSTPFARYAITYFILYTGVPYRITLCMALMMALAAICVAIYALCCTIFNNHIEGWATTVIMLSICFGGLFAILSMVVKYLQTIVFLIFRKKNYIFEFIEKLQ